MLPDVPNFMLYKLVWNAEKQRFRKMPCRLDGSNLQEKETPPMTTRAAAQAALAALPADRYTLGFWITEELKLFFIDLDECVTNGVLTTDASLIAQPFVAAGAFFEPSSSGNGAHIVGRFHGELPPHSNQCPKLHKHGFYTRSRGIALNAAGVFSGDAAIDCTEQLARMLPDVFPPRAGISVLQAVGDRRPEWRGPEDDDELIRRMLGAKGSPAVLFGQRASFSDLWTGRVEQNNESDMALASHLAFWTGCDPDRMERLMRRSGLMRAKWDDHRTYLREITIVNACATTMNVYQEPQRVNTAAVLMGEPVADWNTIVEQQVTLINNAGTYAELMDNIVPAIGPLGIPSIRAERVVTALRKRLELFDSKPPIALLRQLVCPPAMAGDVQQPAWIGSFCYVKRTDKFFNTVTGGEYSHESFRMEYSRFMPTKPNGTKEDPVVWARDRWNIVTVDDTQYRPDQPGFFDYAGKQYANTFVPESMPAITAPSPTCVIAIQAFQQHLYLMCGKRDYLYIALMQWLAHNVQHPGRKIRWSPLLKGVPGDGKSIIGDLIFACMGASNVKMTSPATLGNNGGFTDWATGKAVNFIEEIRLEGKNKGNLFNMMKIFIGDGRTELNQKGKPSGDTMINIMNHWANTNYGDGIPIEKGERRWCVIFSPYQSIEEAVAAKGLPDVDSLVRHFKMLGTSMKAEPGAWRGWLAGVDISSFDPDGRAPDTPERESMKLMSADSLSETIEDILDQGGYGLTKEVFSSSSLQGMVKIHMGEHSVSNNGWHHTLSRMGYQPAMNKTVWWNGKMHRIWAKKTMEADDIRAILDKTIPKQLL